MWRACRRCDSGTHVTGRDLAKRIIDEAEVQLVNVGRLRLSPEEANLRLALANLEASGLVDFDVLPLRVRRLAENFVILICSNTPQPFIAPLIRAIFMTAYYTAQVYEEEKLETKGGDTPCTEPTS